jgi:hypothetical protein
VGIRLAGSAAGSAVHADYIRDGSRGIRAIRFDPRRGETLGDSFRVFDADEPRLRLFGVNPRAQGIGIAKDKLVMLLRESTSNLWTTGLEP